MIRFQSRPSLVPNLCRKVLQSLAGHLKNSFERELWPFERSSVWKDEISERSWDTYILHEVAALWNVSKEADFQGDDMTFTEPPPWSAKLVWEWSTRRAVRRCRYPWLWPIMQAAYCIRWIRFNIYSNWQLDEMETSAYWTGLHRRGLSWCDFSLPKRSWSLSSH